MQIMMKRVQEVLLRTQKWILAQVSKREGAALPHNISMDFGQPAMPAYVVLNCLKIKLGNGWEHYAG